MGAKSVQNPYMGKNPYKSVRNLEKSLKNTDFQKIKSGNTGF